MSIQELPVTTEESAAVAAATAVTGAPAEPIDIERALRFDAAVPRQLVHRSSIAEVFLTDSLATGEDTFEVAAQLPRGHHFGESDQLYDFMLMVEVVRQAGVLVAHRHLDVGLGMQFIFRSLQLHLDDIAAVRIGSRPAKLVVTVTVAPDRSRSGRMKGLRFFGGVRVDGVPALHGEGSLLFLSEQAYTAIRTGMRQAKLGLSHPVTARLAAAPPAVVGRQSPRNVVITTPTFQADGRVAASVVVDVRHPYMFDHPLDHVPGNLELEVFRQLALAATTQRYGLAAEGLTVVGVTGDFTDFAELDLITRATAEVGELRFDDALGTTVAPVAVELTQVGETVASGTVEVAGWS